MNSLKEEIRYFNPGHSDVQVFLNCVGTNNRYSSQTKLFETASMYINFVMKLNLNINVTLNLNFRLIIFSEI